MITNYNQFVKENIENEVEVNIDTFANLAYTCKNWDEFKVKLARATWGLTQEKLLQILNLSLPDANILDKIKTAYFSEKKTLERHLSCT